ncbi:hypothetical protein JCM5296_003255 [Sporobolomyces johnsonii]
MAYSSSESLSETIARLLPNGLGARGDEERDPLVFPHRNLHVLLACSGSVASIKAPLIVRELLKYDQVDVQVVATKSALHFFDAQSIEAEHGGRVKVWTDAEEWAGWNRIGDPILHIELRRWADLVLVAPCSANTLAKLTHGICDNILVRLFPPFIVSHTQAPKQLAFVADELGYTVHGPIAKTLACGDVGIGAMTEWSAIVQLVVDECRLQRRTADS